MCVLRMSKEEKGFVDDFSGITPPRDVRFAASGMYSEMSPALAVAMALSRLEGEGIEGRMGISGAIDDFGNPEGTAYAATGGDLDLSTSDAGDDLAAARALAMNRSAAIQAAMSSSHTHQLRMEEDEGHTSDCAASANPSGGPDATVDEEVAASLREAGVSEHDIMLALRQAQDEQVAMKVQKEEWRSGGGTVNLTNNSRHRPRGQGSDTSVDQSYFIP